MRDIEQFRTRRPPGEDDRRRRRCCRDSGRRPKWHAIATPRISYRFDSYFYYLTGFCEPEAV